jgi:TPP-dependent 2-oxoacid decarboxylase
MEFSVNETKFSNTLDFSDKITIKSSNKNYDVFYSNKNLDTLVKETYEENDFIFIDRNVYNLSPDSFTNLLDNTLIFDAIENNKNIEHVLILIDILLDR